MNNYEITKEKKKPAEIYKFWKDKKMMGTILLMLIVSLQIFAFLKVPFLSTINGYTVGMLFGFYNPFFYMFIAYFALIMIFGDKVKLPKWIKLNRLTYWLVAISIIFISTSLGYYQSKEGFTEIGTKPWGSFHTWYDLFTDNETISAWTPKNTNGGLVGVFLYSFVSMISSGIGAMIASIVALVISVSIIVTGSSIGLYKDLDNRKKLDLNDKEIKDDKESNVKQFETPDDINSEPPKTIEEKPNKDEEEKNINSFPFDDPF